MNFNGKHVFITGASAGIGEEFARQLHAKGAKVTLVARREERLASISKELNEVRAESAGYIVCDLTKIESEGNTLGLKALCEKVREQSIDVFISNAGFGSFGAFDELSVEREQEMIFSKTWRFPSLGLAETESTWPTLHMKGFFITVFLTY